MTASIELNNSSTTDGRGHRTPGAGFGHSIFKSKDNKRFSFHLGRKQLTVDEVIAGIKVCEINAGARALQ